LHLSARRRRIQTGEYGMGHGVSPDLHAGAMQRQDLRRRHHLAPKRRRIRSLADFCHRSPASVRRHVLDSAQNRGDGAAPCCVVAQGHHPGLQATDAAQV